MYMSELRKVENKISKLQLLSESDLESELRTLEAEESELDKHLQKLEEEEKLNDNEVLRLQKSKESMQLEE
jgi:hypothetical protein